jgi:membrane fusion protein (multidrug efflux system)
MPSGHLTLSISKNDVLTLIGSCRAASFSTTPSADPLQAKTLIDGRNPGSRGHVNPGARQKTSRFQLHYLAAGLALSLLAGCGKKAVPPPAAVAVDTATATVQSVPIIGEWVATTDGYVNAQIQPQVSGYLIRQDYQEGGTVRKGQVLFEIDPRPWEAVVNETKGSLAQAQAQLELAGINVNRDTPLTEAHAIAQSTLDNDVQTREADKASVANAQASLQAAELNVGFTKVRSLIDGVAGQALLQVGSLVGQTSVLTSVSQLNPIKVYFYISDQEYLALSARARSGGRGDLLNSGNRIALKMTLSNNQVYPQTGHIVFVDRSVTSQTGSLRIAATFKNPGNLLRPGQYARISAQTDLLQNAILVPQRAVNELQGMYQVVTVGSDDVAHVKTVKLGPLAGKDIVIESGLQAGERVVTEGLDKIKDGMKVAPQAANLNATTNQASSSSQNSNGN